jgi:hypothetical protein
MAARRNSVLDSGYATTRTVYVRPSSREEHIYLSGWSNADPGRSIDNDSIWSSAEQSGDTEHYTDDEPAKRKVKLRKKLPTKKKRGKAQQHDQRKKSANKAKKSSSNKVHDDRENDSKRSCRRTPFNKLFEYSISSDSEAPRRRTRTNKLKSEVRRKTNLVVSRRTSPLLLRTPNTTKHVTHCTDLVMQLVLLHVIHLEPAPTKDVQMVTMTLDA